MGLLDDLTRLVEVEDVSLSAKLESFIDKIVKNSLKKERSKIYDSTKVTKWVLPDERSVVSLTCHEPFCEIMVISDPDLPRPEKGWDCTPSIVGFFGSRSTYLMCAILVSEENYRRAVPSIEDRIKKALAYTNRAMARIKERNLALQKLTKDVKKYLERYVSTFQGDFEVKVERRGPIMVTLSIGDKELPYGYFSIQFHNNEVKMESSFDWKNSTLFDFSLLKNGGKKVIRKFPAIRGVEYRPPFLGRGNLVVRLYWGNPESIERDVIPLLKTLERKDVG